ALGGPTGALVLLLAGPDGRGQQGLLVVVVPVHGSRRDPGGLGDVLHRDRMEAPVDEQGDRLVEDLLLAVLGPTPDRADGLPGACRFPGAGGAHRPARPFGGTPTTFTQAYYPHTSLGKVQLRLAIWCD